MVVWEALDALSHQLELCKVDATTRVVLLVDASRTTAQLEVLRAAVARTRAESIEVREIHSSYDQESAMLQFLSASDVVITAIEDGHLTEAALAAANTVLRIHGDVAPQDFAPHTNMARRVGALHDSVARADTFFLTDGQGTELEVALAGSEVDFDHGIVSDEHRVGAFPSGWVRVVPNKHTARGQLVLMPGDSNLAAARVLSSPLRLVIENDVITQIDGDSPDADVVRALLEFPQESDAYGLAELTIGLNPAQQLDLFDSQRTVPHLARLLGGGVTIGFGDNLLADRPCSQTVSFAMPRRTVRVDDLPVVTHGDLEGDFAPDVYELG